MKTLLALLATASAARAHPGHGAEPGHWLTMPDHVLVVAFGLALVLAVRGARAR